MEDRLFTADVARLLDMREVTWRAYVSRGRAPAPDGREVDGTHVRPWWSRATVAAWSEARRGREWRRGQSTP